MYIIKKISTKQEVLNLTFSRLQCINRRIQVFASLSNHKFDEAYNLRTLIEKYEDKILYSGFIEGKRLRFGFKRNAAIVGKHAAEEKRKSVNLQSVEPLPLTLKYYCDAVEKNEPKASAGPKHPPTDFPYQKTDGSINLNDEHDKVEAHNVGATIADVEVKSRLRLLKNSPNNWMTDYENFNDEVTTDELEWRINYGTPDSRSKVSDVPCGGCGALLHCRDTSIPGYIPSEIFKNHRKEGGTDLKGVICQRCYFLKNYDLALQVRVSTDDYPRVLRTIRNRRRALVILMVDLLDFPCSIWPGVADLLGRGRPIFVVGNKVDLLPRDGKRFLERVSLTLEKGVRETGFAMTDIKHVALISAKTGFGVEDLITKMQSFWQYNGDVFLVGCTNVGKSSLFNALLQSDYCKVQAVDLIQRATTSPWPGTTLNLLKFPIMRPTGWKLYMRSKRLKDDNKFQAEENKLRRIQLRETKNAKYASLIGHLDRTFIDKQPVDESEDPFAVAESTDDAPGSNKFGIDENNKLYALSKWCYDTPGVVQPDQIIHLLTTDELMLTLPKQLLRPQTFIVYPGSSVFIAGLGRLDYVDGKNFARFTVFCSSSLPITICRTDVAEDMYEELLRTEFFAVPINNPDRLKLWPGLKCNRTYTVKGVDWEHSCADVVLSNAGWIAIACGPEMECELKAWAPEKSGVHLRDSLLPRAVSLRGRRLRDSPAYRTDRFYVQK